MKRTSDQVILITALVTASLLTYLIHYVIFRDVYNVFFYGIMDIGFTPISVLLVTIVINRLLTEREKRSLLNKLDMVIGVFFSEIGTRLLREFAALDSEVAAYSGGLALSGTWTESRFKEEMGRIGGYPHKIDVRSGELAHLQVFLHDKRGVLLRLLENPNLLQHETFTELLLAVTHLVEELDYRDDLNALPPSDRAHLSGDVRRAYALLIREWLTYLTHLKTNYPYLFSLAVRTNPFDPEAKVVITD